MKNTSMNNYIALIFSILLISISLTDCKKNDNPIKFPNGTFPDTVVNLANINTQYDDYNTALYQLNGNASVIFSSNRGSSGKQFDLVQASISFQFDQTTGVFGLGDEMTTDPFLAKLINQANTPGNDFGPYRLLSSQDGYEYLLLSSQNAEGDLDFYYLKNLPMFNSTLPDITGPYPITLLNTTYDDAYISFNSTLDSCYFSSNRGGDFDIYLQVRPATMDLTTWFNQVFANSAKVDSVNSTSDDKCPLIYNNIMVFASNRSGGLGGFDLYYSVFSNGKWGSPINFGPKINSASDEYRPIIGYEPGFTNQFLMFSSNRPGGKGGFDLYFTGVEFPTK